MAKRILIDATHAEETRVVVVSGNRIEEFDYESSTRKALRGNVYLAKVTRVEPSLQAAFVDYGGNRHGFLPFPEIHPDYFRLPVADREALAVEESRSVETIEPAEAVPENGAAPERPEPASETSENGGASQPAEESVETIGGDLREELERRRRRLARRYKIQEVIKRRQILLVQVTKEERGTKGAALTTYLSLAGRYCVLMPNTARGGGVSRKITNQGQRKRLKSLYEELGVPDGMSIIFRTAGEERSKAEIKRDFEYLVRLWDEIREETLNSTAPKLIYEEADVIRRAIRDLYTRDVQEIVVDGEPGYKIARTFMKTMIPSHAKRVQLYRDHDVPLFHRYQVEAQLDTIYSPEVHLKSGGYIVMNATEALVAIDVNSGRATRERNIEETALRTNIEAAEEIARQLRLRDLAGLIVIDFIDMEETRNAVAVERSLKEAMKHDRARLQIGRISHFGLLEMSRQRLRTSFVELNTQRCPTCGGAGIVRSAESTALQALRAIEDEGLKRPGGDIVVHLPSVAALQILNKYRHMLAEIEERCRVRVAVQAEEGAARPTVRVEHQRPRAEAEEAEGGARRETREKPPQPEERAPPPERAPVAGAGVGGRGAERAEAEARAAPAAAQPAREAPPTGPQAAAGGESPEQRGRRRRRGRRGGRRRGRRGGREHVAQAERAPAEAAPRQDVRPEPGHDAEPMAEPPVGADEEPADIAPHDSLEPEAEERGRDAPRSTERDVIPPEPDRGAGQESEMTPEPEHEAETRGSRWRESPEEPAQPAPEHQAWPEPAHGPAPSVSVEPEAPATRPFAEEPAAENQKESRIQRHGWWRR